MEALGRMFNVAPTMDGVAVRLPDGAAVTFIGVGADTYTITSATVFAGPYATPGNVLDHGYVAAAANGTVPWTRQAVAPASNAIVSASAVCAIHVNAKQLKDGERYVMCTSTAAGLVIAIVHDLEVQRTPPNLKALSVA